MDRRRFMKVIGAAGAGIAAAAALPPFPALATGTGMLPLGKLPAQPGLVKIRLADFVKLDDMPVPPDNFGHFREVKTPWGMAKNDEFGDCVFAGGAHEHMLLSTVGGKPAKFSDASILKAYSDVTGFNPSKPETDRGTLVIPALDYRRTVGMKDTKGVVHKIEGHATIHTALGGYADLELLSQAIYLFGVVGVGIELPAYAMDQFKAGKPWDVQTKNTRILGGHYIPIVGMMLGKFVCVTWGKLQLITPRFLARYCDEAHAIFDTEFLKKGKSPEGVDLKGLQRALTELT